MRGRGRKVRTPSPSIPAYALVRGPVMHSLIKFQQNLTIHGCVILGGSQHRLIDRAKRPAIFYSKITAFSASEFDIFCCGFLQCGELLVTRFQFVVGIF